MNRSILGLIVIAPFAAACAGSFPPPTQRMADAQSAERSATELGANSEPVAKLSLKLADEQIAMAKAAMSDGDNRRADGLLIRAKADAELAVAQSREKGAKQDKQRAVDDSNSQNTTNTLQGAGK